MLTRREVEGELRSLGFRATARQRRAERERALRFARGAFGVLVGIVVLMLVGAVNFLQETPADIAFGHASNARATEWVSGGTQDAAPRRSLFFGGRRTWHPADPRGRNRDGHRGDD